MGTTLAPASISIRFRPIGEEGAMLSLHGHYPPEICIRLLHISGMKAIPYQTSGDCCEVFSVHDDDMFFVYVFSPSGEQLEYGSFDVNVAFVDEGIILCPSHGCSLSIDQSRADVVEEVAA